MTNALTNSPDNDPDALFFDLLVNDRYDSLSLPGLLTSMTAAFLCLMLHSLKRCIVSMGDDTCSYIGHRFFIRMGNIIMNGKKSVPMTTRDAPWSSF